MYLYLPVALTSINILIPVGLGLVVGLLSGLFGVGGGFLMTPLLIMFGIPSTVAAATDSNQIVAASTSGTYAHWKIGNVDFKMGIHLLIGGFIGGLLGVQGIKILRAMGNADFVIKMHRGYIPSGIHQPQCRFYPRGAVAARLYDRRSGRSRIRQKT